MKTKENHIHVVVGSSIVATIIFLLVYWKIEDTYFASLSNVYSGIIAISLAGITFSLFAYGFSKSHFKAFVKETTKKIDEVNGLHDKIFNLEKRLLSLKTENAILIAKIEEASRKDGSTTGPKGSRFSAVASQKFNIILHERAFLHTISNKVQILKSATSSVSEFIESLDPKESQHILRQLEIAKDNIEKMSVLLKENREYLIIAS